MAGRHAALLCIRRGKVHAVDDGGGMQKVQVEVFAGDVRDGRDRPQPYGLTSQPHADSEAIVLAAGGNPNDSLVICIDDRRYRLTGLTDGEVALYDDLGQIVHLTRDGIVVATSQTVRIEGRRIEVAASEAVHIGAGGVGPTYTPTGIVNYTLGVPTSMGPPKEVDQR